MSGSVWEPGASQVPVYPALALAGGSDLMGHLGDGSGAVMDTVGNVLRETVSVFRFMSPAQKANVRNRLRTTDITGPFNLAVAYLVYRGGGRIFVPNGDYYLLGVPGTDTIVDGILIPWTGYADDGAQPISIEIVGESRETRIFAGTANMNIIRCSNGYGAIKRLALYAEALAGVKGIALIPQDTVSPNINSAQSFNSISDLYIHRCKESILMQCGGNGGTYYNEFRNIQLHGGSQPNTRGLYLKTGVVAVGGSAQPSSVNRNQFYSVRFAYMNTGIEIESGDTNSFFGCSAEGIQAGATPNATPIAINIKEAGNLGGGNENNKFFGFTAEACTADLNCQNPRTVFVGCYLNGAKTTLHPAFATYGTMTGNYDFTMMPEISGTQVSAGSNMPAGMTTADYALGAVTTALPRVIKGGLYKSYPLTEVNVQGIISIQDARCYYQASSDGYVDLTIRFMFKPVANNSTLRIPVPLRAINAALSSYSIIQPLLFPLLTTAGAGPLSHYARFNYDLPDGNYLEVLPVPANPWNIAAGNNNQVHIAIRYKTA